MHLYAEGKKRPHELQPEDQDIARELDRPAAHTRAGVASLLKAEREQRAPPRPT